LTLLSAPAGFGKTTLLAEWLASPTSPQRHVSWLSLDEADDDPSLFWIHLIHALQRAVPAIGQAALAVLDTAQPPPITDILAMVLNDLAAMPDDIVVVLDDYHAVPSPEIQAGMTYLLDHLPPPAHLVIATRADPALQLARLRARGELVEIRAADLRFTSGAAEAFLSETMGLTLDAADVAALTARTEGWITALQLAALSLQGREDPAGFIASFTGDDRYIVDYLVEEVLRGQTEGVRSFLLETSILDRLGGDLCDAVTDREGTRATLERLDRANLFLVPLDDRRDWYRYHHLFADVLRARLTDEPPGHVAELHRRASQWYEANGRPSDAIRHALAGEDHERAARLVELALPSLRQARAIPTIRAWLEAIPDDLYVARPVLNVTRAGIELADGEVADVEARLRDAERWVDGPSDAGDANAGGSSRAIVADHDAFRRLPATIAIYRAAQALGVGDVGRVKTEAQRAIDGTGPKDHFERGAAQGFLALATWRDGDLETAYHRWSDAMASLERAGHAVDALGCIRPLAEIRIAQGRLTDAMRLYQRGLMLATRDRQPVLRGAGDMHVGMSGLLTEWNDLDAARDHLEGSTGLGDHAGLALNPYRWHIAMARLREIEGDLGAALEELDEAERRYVGEFYPDTRPVAALRARLWIAQGRLADAITWAEDRGLTAADDVTYVREFEYLVFARVLIARRQRDRDDEAARDAAALLARLEAAAEVAGRGRSRIEVLVLQAVLAVCLGQTARAQAAVDRALRMAEAGGSVRVFVDEGAPMAALLADAVERGVALGYARLLLAALATPGKPIEAQEKLLEPLSRRELEVLQLLSTELDGPDIARQLVVGVSTVRSHTKSIYAKLGVTNRRAAVRRGEELGLLPRTRRG
jgi:LuxR family maltose regulon positive regulatory protein